MIQSRLRTDHDQVFFLYNFINFLRPKTSKQVFTVRHRTKSLETQKFVAYTFNEVVGLKSTFIITGAFKEAITEIENY